MHTEPVLFEIGDKVVWQTPADLKFFDSQYDYLCRAYGTQPMKVARIRKAKPGMHPQEVVLKRGRRNLKGNLPGGFFPASLIKKCKGEDHAR